MDYLAVWELFLKKQCRGYMAGIGGKKTYVNWFWEINLTKKIPGGGEIFRTHPDRP
jgi:hypothetical protein